MSQSAMNRDILDSLKPHFERLQNVHMKDLFAKIKREQKLTRVRPVVLH